MPKQKKRILLLVAAPPSSGKTFIAKKIAESFPNCTYLDLDSLNVLSERICVAAGQPFDKGGDFFKDNGRDFEYRAVFNFSYEALDFCNLVIISAPLTKEIRDNERFSEVAAQAAEHGAEVIPVWVLSSASSCKKNMFERNFARDSQKRANMDYFLSQVCFDRPALISPAWQVDNRTRESWQIDVARIVSQIKKQLSVANNETEECG